MSVRYVLDAIVGGLVALTGLTIASTLIRAGERRAGRSSEALADGAAWSALPCC